MGQVFAKQFPPEACGRCDRDLSRLNYARALGLVNEVSMGIRQQVQLRADEPAPEPLRTFQQKATDITDGLVGNTGVLDDPRAATVVYAATSTGRDSSIRRFAPVRSATPNVPSRWRVSATSR